MNYLPFNSVDHDRVYKAEDWAWYFSTFIGNGVFPQPSDGLQVQADSAMTVKVRPGYGFINGYAFRNQLDYQIVVDTADGVLNRIDRIVLRWDLASRKMSLEIIKGNPSAEPTAPAITRNADVYELALADISVGKGVTNITQAMITDRRYSTDVCGIVTGVVDQVDASALTKQFDDFFDSYTEKTLENYNQYLKDIEAYKQGAENGFTNWSITQKDNITQWENDYKDSFSTWMTDQQTDMTNWKSQQTADFNTWFSSLKSALDGDIATKLTTKTDDHEERIAFLEYMARANDYFAPLIDDDGNYILDDAGNAIIVDWKYNFV